MEALFLSLEALLETLCIEDRSLELVGFLPFHRFHGLLGFVGSIDLVSP